MTFDPLLVHRLIVFFVIRLYKRLWIFGLFISHFLVACSMVLPIEIVKLQIFAFGPFPYWDWILPYAFAFLFFIYAFPIDFLNVFLLVVSFLSFLGPSKGIAEKYADAVEQWSLKRKNFP